MAIKVTFLGTGMATPTRERWHPSILLNYNGQRLLFDCGEGVQIRLIEQKLGIMKIDQVFITHYHGDHFLGLPGLIQTMGMYGRQKPLQIFGPRGLEEFIDLILKFNREFVAFDVYGWEVKEKGIQKILEGEQYEVYATLVKHTCPSLAFSFEEKGKWNIDLGKAKKFGLKEGPLLGKLKKKGKIKFKGKEIKLEQVADRTEGKKIVYSGDLIPCDSIIELAKNADLFVCEASFTDDLKERASEVGHSTAKQAAQMAKKANVKKLILTHISPRYSDDPGPLLREAKNIFNNTVLAEDLMEIEV